MIFGLREGIITRPGSASTCELKCLDRAINANIGRPHAAGEFSDITAAEQGARMRRAFDRGRHAIPFTRMADQVAQHINRILLHLQDKPMSVHNGQDSIGEKIHS